MKIGLIAVDSQYPNLALMKIARYWRQEGAIVEWWTPFDKYDVVYLSKIFTFTPDFKEFINNADLIMKGGTGYDLETKLPDNIDKLQPDYSIYPTIDNKTAYGFLTRGCPNKCYWCVVPKKEGAVTPYMDIEEIAIEGRNKIILMDNNILASDYGLSQLEKIMKLKLKVDFNQALDARLVTPGIAEMLSKIKWIKRIRFGCDTPAQISHCEKAIKLIRQYGYKGEFFLYCILNDYRESLERVSFWRKDPKVVIHCQPYRDFNNPKQIIPQWQKDMARWADRKEIFFSTTFNEFSPRKNFTCREYNKLLN